MDYEQIVNELIELFRENEIEAVRARGDAPAMVLSPDALGVNADRTVIMNVAPVFDDEESIVFELFTLIVKGVFPENKGEFFAQLNQLNVDTTCGTYIYLKENGFIAHRLTVCSVQNGYMQSVPLTVDNVLNTINEELQLLDTIIS